MLTCDVLRPFCRFLEIAEKEVGVGQDFSLENMAQSLGKQQTITLLCVSVVHAYIVSGFSGLIPSLF